METNPWYTNWFNSPYYHILYKERDTGEAEAFLDNLIFFLKIPEHARILDLACGKGRHSFYLNKRGFDVTGVDLSEESIRYAEEFENLSLSFFVHDMRLPLRINYFDYILNLFTSFGYFNDKENQKVIESIGLELKPGGKFVFDFMNTNKVLRNLVSNEVKSLEGMDFDIKRYVENNTIFKEIDFTDKGQKFHYKEEVKVIFKKDMERYFERSALKILHSFGDYELNPYDEINSDRLILVAEKAR